MARQATGIVRRVDELGRIVLPKELRDSLELGTGTPVGFFVTEDAIVLQRHAPGCVFCGAAEADLSYRCRLICDACARAVGKLPPPTVSQASGGSVRKRRAS